MQIGLIKIQDTAIEDLKVHVSITQSKQAKLSIIKHFEGNVNIEFAKLEDYTEEHRRSNKVAL